MTSKGESKEPSGGGVEILVCQAQSCRLAGAAGALLEIEELAKGLPCTVSESGCVGNCSEAPNALILRPSDDQGGQPGGGGSDEDEQDQEEGELVARVTSLAVSADVVEIATGVRPSLDDPVLLERLGSARQARLAEEAKAAAHWNCALGALAGLEAGLRAQDGQPQPGKLSTFCQALMDQAACLESARQPAAALGKVEEVLIRMAGNVTAHFTRSRLLYALGRPNEGLVVLQRLAAVPPLSRFAISVALEARRLMAENERGVAVVQDRDPPDGFATWTVERVEPVSRWTAIYHLRSDDPRRGAVHVRGRGRTTWRKLWHTTLLARVGANAEGPLPYIERDYTAISTAQEWEAGACRLLIKIYPHGKATQWILRHLRDPGSTVQLSRPATTLRVPSLVPEKAARFAAPRGVLVLSGGTGIAPVVQILQTFGPLPIPVVCFHSCRADDVVLLSELDELCNARSGAAATRVTVCITPASTEQQAFFAAPPPPADPLGQTHVGQTLHVHHGRISENLLTVALQDMPASCRGVITGPEAFNAHFAALLAKLGLARENQTVLEA